MKKILLILFSLLFISVNAEALRGGVTEEYIPEGFFGSWGVISKLNSATTPSMFNYESRDIWMLSGVGNILILENLESGARSEILIREKSLDGKTLRFQREKVVKDSSKKLVYTETVEFILSGNNFKGTDSYTVNQFDLKGNQVKVDKAQYTISGVRISGTNP